MGKLINRIPGLRLLISSLPGTALILHVESLGKPGDVNKPCLENLISKDTHLYMFCTQETLPKNKIKAWLNCMSASLAIYSLSTC